MSIPAGVLTTTCDVYRPFGAGSPTATAVPCRLVDDLDSGRTPGGLGVMWTHHIDLDPSADVRDGCSRTVGANAVSYGDGDEVRIPSGGSARYVVVWVTVRELGTAQAYKRAYLLRHSA